MEQIIQDVHDIKNTLTKLGVRLEIVYNCLVGNEILKDGGLVAELGELMVQFVKVLNRIDDIEKKERQRSLYVKIIWGAVAALLTVLVSHFLK